MMYFESAESDTENHMEDHIDHNEELYDAEVPMPDYDEEVPAAEYDEVPVRIRAAYGE